MDFDQVHVVLTRPGSTTDVLDTVITFPAGADSVTLNLLVDITGASEQLTLVMEFIDQPGNNVVFTVGPTPVTATAGGGGQAQVLPPPIYVGPGSNAVGIRFVSTASNVYFQDSVVLTAEALDASNNVVAAPIRWTSSDTTRAFLRADSTGRVIAKSVRGAVSVSASLLRTSPTVTPASVSHGVTVQPRANSVTVQSGNSQTGAVGAALPQPVVARVLATDNLGVQGVIVTFAVVSGGGTLSALIDTTDANGDVQTSWTLGGTIGPQSVSATVTGIPVATATFGATGAPGAVARVAFQQEPTTANENAIIAPAVTVRAVDQFGNVNTSFNQPITVAILSNPGGGTLSGTATQTAVAGVATFNNLAINLAGTGYTLRATSASLAPDTSVAFNIVAVTPVAVQFQVHPVSTPSNVTISPAVEVRLVTAGGSTATGATNPVTLAVGINPAGGTLSGTLTVNAVAGVATFSNLQIDNIGTGYTLVASAPGLTGATSSAFNVTASPVANLWLRTTGGIWGDPTNWSRGVVPGPLDTAEIRQCGTYTVDLDVNVQIARLVVGCPTSGTQTLRVNGFSLRVDSTGSFGTRGRLLLDNGTVTGAGPITVAGKFDWQGGALDGAGGRLTVTAGGLLDLSGVTKTLNNGYLLENGGTAQWVAGDINSGSGAVLRNLSGGTLGLATNAAFHYNLGGAVSKLENAGTLNGVVSAGSFSINVPLDNSGSVDVQTGTLVTAGGGTSSGSFVARSGSTLDFQAGTSGLTGTSSIGGAGTVRVSGGIVALGGSLAVTGTLDVAGGTLDYNGGTPGSTTTLLVSNGVLGGSGRVDVTGGMSWTGGSLSGAGGITRVLPGATLAIGTATTKTLNNAYALELAGTGSWLGGPMNSGSGATLRVLAGGTLDLLADVNFNYNLGGAQSVFHNQGTISRTTGIATFTVGALFNNDATVNVTSGVLDLAGGGTSSGAHAVSSGATLRYGGGTHTLSPAASISGAGLMTVPGATVTHGGSVTIAQLLVNGGTANLNGATNTLTNLSVATGQLGGNGLVTVSGAFTWSGGSLTTGTGTTRVLAGGTMAISGAATKTLNGGYTLEQAGTGTWAGTGSMNSGSGAVLRVLAGGTLDLQASAAFNYNLGGAQSVFHNQGTVTRTTAGTMTIGALLHNDNLVTLSGGQLSLAGGGTSSGNFSTNTGTTVEFTGGTHTLSGGSSIGGGGTFVFSGGTVTTSGGFGPNALSIAGGTFNYNGGTTGSVTNLTVSGGTLGGNGLITVAGAMSFTGGSLSTGTGTTRVLSGGTLSLAGGTKTLNASYSLENEGTATWSAGQFNAGSGAVLRNLAGGTLNISAGVVFNYNLGGAAPSFENAGTLTKSGTGVAVMGAPFVNTGSVSVTGDTLRISGGGSLGSTLAATTGTIELNSSNYTLVPGMSLTGAGGLYLSGATLTIASANDSVSVENLRFDNGTINGAGILRIVNTFQWNGGSLTGTSTTRILSGASATLAGATKTLAGALLENNGSSFTWSAGQINSGSAGTIRNLSGRTITTTGAVTLAYNLGGAASVLDNQGTVLVNGGSLTISAQLSSSGVLNPSVGDLILTGGGTLSGSATPNATLFFNTGTYNLLNGFSTSGTGDAFLAGATLAIGGGATVSMARLIFNSGTLDNQGTLGVTSRLEWAGGSLTGAGSTSVPGTGTLAMLGGTKTLTGAHTLNLSGTGTWTAGAVNSGGAAMFRILSTGTFNNSGTGAFNFNLGGGQPQFVVEGTFQRTTAVGFFNLGAFFVDTALSASVTVAAGTTMNLQGGGRIANTPNIAGLLNLSSAVSFKAGTGVIGGGLVQVNSGGTLSTDSAGTVTIPNLDLVTGGTIDHEGLLIVSGQMNWSGGALGSNTAGLGGITRINAGALLNISTAATKTYTGTHELDNQGTVTFAAGDINTGSGAVIRNGQNFNWTGDTRILYNLGGATPVFRNLAAGTLSRTTGTGLAQLGSSLENSGAISVSSGTLSLAGGSGIPFTGTATQSGPGVLDINGGTFTQNGPFTVTGNIGISGGTWNPGGQTLTVNGNLTTSATGALSMTTAADVVDINGNATFGGSPGIMNAGVLQVSGNFAQVGAGTHFAPTAQSATVAHRVLLDGTAGVTTSVSFANPSSNFFRRLTAAKPGGSTVRLDTDVRTTFFSMAGGTYSMTGLAGPTMVRLTADTVAGANSTSVGMFSPMVLVANAALVDSNVINVDTIVYAGANQVIQNTYPGGPAGRYTFQNIRVAQTAGTATFAANATVPQDLIVSSGTLSLTGRQIAVNGDFRTETSGALQMTAVSDSLGVAGDVTFSGASTTGLLTNGIISVNGNFSQSGNTNAFAPTINPAGHRVSLRGSAVQNIGLTNANVTQSRFNALEVVANNRNVVLSNNVYADSMVVFGGGSAVDVLSAGTTQRLMVRKLRVTQQTLSPLVRPAVLEISAFPQIDSIGLGRGVSPDTFVINGGVTTFPEGRPMHMNHVRINTGAVINYSSSNSFADSIRGNLIIEGGSTVFNVGGTGFGLVVTGSLTTRVNGQLRMQTGGADMRVMGDANFGGGTAAGQLTNGILRVHGNFTQTGTSTFQATGLHETNLGSGTGAARRQVSFAAPGTGAAQSRFARLRLGPVVSFVQGAGAVELLTNVQANLLTDSAATDTIFASTGAEIMTIDTMQASDVVFERTRLVLGNATTGGTSNHSTSNIVFRNMLAGQTFVTVNRSTGTAATLNGFTMNSTPSGGGLYVTVNAPTSASVSFPSSTPAGSTVCPLTSKTGAAAGTTSLVWAGLTCP